MTQQLEEARISMVTLESDGSRTTFDESISEMTDEFILSSMLSFYIRLGFNSKPVRFTSGCLTLFYTPPVERDGVNSVNGSYEISIIDDSDKKMTSHTILPIKSWGDY